MCGSFTDRGTHLHGRARDTRTVRGIEAAGLWRGRDSMLFRWRDSAGPPLVAHFSDDAACRPRRRRQQATPNVADLAIVLSGGSSRELVQEHWRNAMEWSCVLRTASADARSGPCRAEVPRRRTRRLMGARQARSYRFDFGFVGFAGFVPSPSAFTLASVPPELSAIGSHPGIPCRMRSAFLVGVMCP